MTCQKAPVLSHLSKGRSPRLFVACQCVFWQIPVLLFYYWCPLELYDMGKVLLKIVFQLMLCVVLLKSAFHLSIGIGMCKPFLGWNKF